jgi:hypothetical protein
MIDWSGHTWTPSSWDCFAHKPCSHLFPVPLTICQWLQLVSGWPKLHFDSEMASGSPGELVETQMAGSHPGELLLLWVWGLAWESAFLTGLLPIFGETHWSVIFRFHLEVFSGTGWVSLIRNPKCSKIWNWVMRAGHKWKTLHHETLSHAKYYLKYCIKLCCQAV